MFAMNRPGEDAVSLQLFEQCAYYPHYRYEEPSRASSAIFRSMNACFLTLKVIHITESDPTRSVLTYVRQRGLYLYK